jgi:hypothetical protein
MKHTESENLYINRAQLYLTLGEQEPDNEAQYLWKAQVLATLAQAVELERSRLLLDRMAERLEKLVESTDDVAAELSNVAQMVGELQLASD